MNKSFVLFFLIGVTFYHQQVNGQVNSQGWKTTKGSIVEKAFKGRKALYLDQGLAYLEASSFTEGVIEVDILTPLMAGIAFRIDTNQHHYEEVYIRTPKSGGLDAVQYVPDYNGEFSWQFYQEYQAAATFPENDWVHLKVIVADNKAGVFISNGDSAVLFVDSLRISNKTGRIGLWSLRGAYFSNLQYRKALPNEKLPDIPRVIVDNPNAIKQWSVSEPMEFKEPGLTLRVNKLKGLNWQTGTTEPDGYLNINRFARKKIWGLGRLNSNDMVWLKYEWNEVAPTVKAFSFEYANNCYIYYDQQKIFKGENTFLLKGAFYRGDIDRLMQANTIYIPAKKGKNVLYVAVSGITNGWGFMGQFVPAAK